MTNEQTTKQTDGRPNRCVGRNSDLDASMIQLKYGPHMAACKGDAYNFPHFLESKRYQQQKQILIERK